jgi:hypothetical protein
MILSNEQGNDLNIGVSGLGMGTQKFLLSVQQHFGERDDHQPASPNGVN